MATSRIFKDYDDDDPDIKYREKRWEFWAALKKCREDYTGDASYFISWVEETYGIRLLTADGHITDKYGVVDEQKYLVFLLKYK